MHMEYTHDGTTERCTQAEARQEKQNPLQSYNLDRDTRNESLRPPCTSSYYCSIRLVLDIVQLRRLDVACSNQAIRRRYLESIQAVDVTKLPSRGEHCRLNFFSSLNVDVSSLVLLDWLSSRFVRQQQKQLPVFMDLRAGKRQKVIDSRHVQGQSKTYDEVCDVLVKCCYLGLRAESDASHLSWVLTIFPRIVNLHMIVDFDPKEELPVFFKTMISHYDTLSPMLESLNMTLNIVRQFAYFVSPRFPPEERETIIDTFFSLYGSRIRILKNFNVFLRNVNFLLTHCPNIQVLTVKEGSAVWELVTKETKLIEIGTDWQIPVNKLQFFSCMEKYEVKGLDSRLDRCSFINACLTVLTACKNIKSIDVPDITWRKEQDGSSTLRLSCEKYDGRALAALRELLCVIPKITILHLSKIFANIFILLDLFGQTSHLAYVIRLEAYGLLEDCSEVFLEVMKYCQAIEYLQLPAFTWSKIKVLNEMMGSMNKGQKSPVYGSHLEFWPPFSISESSLLEAIKLIPPLDIITFSSVSDAHIVTTIVELCFQSNLFSFLRNFYINYESDYQVNFMDIFLRLLQTSRDFCRFEIFGQICWTKHGHGAIVRSPSHLLKNTPVCYSSLKIAIPSALFPSAKDYSDYQGTQPDQSVVIQSFSQVLSMIPQILVLNFEVHNSEDHVSVFVSVSEILQNSGHTNKVAQIQTSYLSEEYLHLIKSFYPEVEVFECLDKNIKESSALFCNKLLSNYPDIYQIKFRYMEWSKSKTTGSASRVLRSARSKQYQSSLLIHYDFEFEAHTMKQHFALFLKQIPLITKLRLSKLIDTNGVKRFSGLLSATHGQEQLRSLLNQARYSM